jgi:Fur family ferric uptake transcriptional regulator
MTRQRALILEVLRGVASHPTADEIYGMVRAKMPRISLGPVYRNLDLLTNTGAILRLDRAGAQKRFDGDTSAHLHVRCKHCGRIGDVRAAPALPPFQALAASGFTIEHMEVEFTGVCDACRDCAK